MRIILATMCLLVFTVGVAEADTIDILWYSGGVVDSFTQGGGGYKGDISTNLVASAASGGGGAISAMNTWNITYWDAGPMPGGSFDVMVVVSDEGGWNTYPNYASLNGAAGGIGLGDRVMVTGQDADWHYLNNFGHQTTFNSSQGFLIDAINWAGSGTGLGAVFLSVPTTTLAAFGLTASLGTEFGGSNSITIPPAFASFPINEGLTSAGLSNWGTSAHDSWQGWDTTAWTGINVITGTARAITLVSADTAGGGTTGGGPVPEPGTIVLLAIGAGGLLVRRRRRQS